MIIKSLKIILAGTIISVSMIGIAFAGEHCGYFVHDKWNGGSIEVFNEDLEAKTNVTGKCPSFIFVPGSKTIDIVFTSKTRIAEWERYNGSVIGISGTIEYRTGIGDGPRPVIYNPKIIWD